MNPMPIKAAQGGGRFDDDDQMVGPGGVDMNAYMRGIEEQNAY